MNYLKYPFFTADEYHTPTNYKHMFIDKLCFNSRWPFILIYLKYIFRLRDYALRGIYDNKMWGSSSVKILQIIESVGGRFHISGINNIKNLDKPVVFISNHMSTLETMVFPGIIDPHTKFTYVVKKSLITNKIFGPVMRASNPIAVDRKNSKHDLLTVMNEGLKNLNNGISVLIFPQSTRVNKFDPKKFNTLGIKLALKANVQVIPIAIKTDFWGNGKYLREFGKIDRKKPIYIKFGKPLTVKGRGKEEHQQVIDFITENITTWENSTKS